MKLVSFPFFKFLWVLLGVCLNCTFAGDWQTGGGYRWKQLDPPAPGRTGFAKLEGSVTGIRFSSQLAPERYLTNTMLLNGSGVALGDVDGDGWCDVFLCRLAGGSVLYRNLGNWKFEDISQTAGGNC